MSEGTRSEAMPAGDEPESRRTTTTTNSSAADSGDDDDPQGEVEDFFDIDPRSLSYSSSTDLNSSRSSSCDASTGASGTCAVSVLSTPGHSKPHKANDAGWEAIRGISLGSAPRPLGISQFRILHRLGRGDIGSVYLAELRGTACHFALKVMDKKGLSSRNKLLRAETERAILQMLDHPFLPTLYAHLDNAHFSCLVMEFCPGGDLHVLRQRQPAKRFGDHAARFYAAEVLLALEYLHMMGIVYRDLKPENVLVRDDGHIMLTDFDLSLQSSVRPSLLRTPEVPRRPVPSTTSSSSSSSCILPACVMPCTGAPQGQHPAVVVSCLPMFTRRKKSKAKAKAKAKVKQWHRGHDATETLGVTLPELLAEPTEARSMSFVGTHEYLSPEIIAGDGHGNAVDWWTFGIFLFELLYGRTPFRGSDNEKTLANVVSQPLRFPDEGAEVGGMLSPPPSTAAKDLVMSLLVKDPFKRLGSTRGATEIKQHAFFHGVNWALIRCSIPPHIPSPFHPPTRCSPPPEKNASSDFEYF